MSDLKYEEVERVPKEELIARLANADPKVVAAALYSATRWDPDWQGVQQICVQYLASPHVPIRWAAATCLGDLAFFRRPLDCDIVIPALTTAMADPTISDPAAFSLSMISSLCAASRCPAAATERHRDAARRSPNAHCSGARSGSSCADRCAPEAFAGRAGRPRACVGGTHTCAADRGS